MNFTHTAQMSKMKNKKTSVSKTDYLKTPRQTKPCVLSHVVKGTAIWPIDKTGPFHKHSTFQTGPTEKSGRPRTRGCRLTNTSARIIINGAPPAGSQRASPELSRTMAFRHTNSSGFSLRARKREVVASSMSKISTIPSTQSPSFLQSRSAGEFFCFVIQNSPRRALYIQQTNKTI